MSQGLVNNENMNFWKPNATQPDPTQFNPIQPIFNISSPFKLDLISKFLPKVGSDHWTFNVPKKKSYTSEENENKTKNALDDNDESNI